MPGNATLPWCLQNYPQEHFHPAAGQTSGPGGGNFPRPGQRWQDLTVSVSIMSENTWSDAGWGKISDIAVSPIRVKLVLEGLTL